MANRSTWLYSAAIFVCTAISAAPFDGAETARGYGKSLGDNSLKSPVTTVLMAMGSAPAQTPTPSQDDASQLLSDLTRQVQELRLEVASLRVAWHENRMQLIDEQVRAAVRERLLAEYEDAAAEEAILTAQTQLSGSELDEAERSEMVSQKDVLLTEGQQRLQRRAQALERESALRGEWERERAAAEMYRGKLRAPSRDVTKPSHSSPGN